MTKSLSQGYIFIYRTREEIPIYSDNPFLRRHVENVSWRYHIRDRVPNGKFSFSFGLYFSSLKRTVSYLEFHHGVSRILRAFACTYTWASAKLRAMISVSFQNLKIPDSFRSLHCRSSGYNKIPYLVSRPRFKISK